MELYEASNQWATRPPDERKTSLKDLYSACLGYFRRSGETEGVDLKALKVFPQEGDLVLEDASGTQAGFTNWAFKQFCQRVGAPAAYLAKLPATIAATCINHGLQAGTNGNGDAQASLLVQTLEENRNAYSKVVMAATSDRYSRIWNWEIADRLLRLELLDQGWRVPPARTCQANQPGARPATEEDLLDSDKGGGGMLSLSVGDLIAPAGIYCSDHDMFVFLVNEQARVADGTSEGMSRGFFVSNSEVGAAAFKITRFLYRHVCGNHIVWGASKVAEIKVRHVGSAPDRAWAGLQADLKEYSEESASDEEAMVSKATTFSLGNDKDQVLDKLFGLDIAPRKVLDAAFDSTEALYPLDGSPRTAWGMVQGITRQAQVLPFGDARMSLDRAAGKVMEVVS